MDIWNQIHFFNKRENWGRPNQIDPKLLLILDAYRKELDIPLYVSKGVALPGTHDVKKSAHYVDEKTGYAYAVDLIPLLSRVSGKTLFDCFLLATKYPFSGIGVYPKWRLSRIEGKGKVVERGGLHLDTSPHRKLMHCQSSGHWIGVPGKQFKQQYFGVSKCNLKKYSLI